MTRVQTTIALVVGGVVALLLGWQFGTPSKDSGQRSVAPGTLVFPGLAPKLQAAERITVQTKGKTLVIARKDGVWGLADRGGYRVQQDRLRELLTGLTELRVTEARTANPEQYARLGVDDPSLAVTTANLLRVLGPNDAVIAELIVGHRRVRTAGNVPESIYIRRPGEAQSWLAEGRLPVDGDAQLWFEREITNIGKDRVASIVSVRGDSILEFGRDGAALVLKSPVEQPKLDEYRVEEVFRALESLTLSDVKPASEQPGEKLGSAVITTLDGMAITVTVFKAEAEIWAQFAVLGEGESKEAGEALQARIGGWAYQLGAWKEKAFLPTVEELKAEEPEKKPTE